jgi:acyl-CoA reductase-like NAD-dependent aldehyde dehydrogenase
VIEQSRKNIEFIMANPDRINQAKQINTAISNIVASERNEIMRRAVDMTNKRHEDLQKLRQLPSGS